MQIFNMRDQFGLLHDISTKNSENMQNSIEIMKKNKLKHE